MRLSDIVLGAADAKARTDVHFSHGRDRYCFSRYVSGLHAARRCAACPHLRDCPQGTDAPERILT